MRQGTCGVPSQLAPVRRRSPRQIDQTCWQTAVSEEALGCPSFWETSYGRRRRCGIPAAGVRNREWGVGSWHIHPSCMRGMVLCASVAAMHIETASAPARNSVVAVPPLVITGAPTSLDESTAPTKPFPCLGTPSRVRGTRSLQLRGAKEPAEASQSVTFCLSCHFCQHCSFDAQLADQHYATAALRKRGGQLPAAVRGETKRQGPRLRGQNRVGEASADALFHGVAPSDVYAS